MKSLSLLFLILTTQAEARELCFPQLHSTQQLCFSPGKFEVDTTELVTVKQNGENIDQFEATVTDRETSEDWWSGGRNCIRESYPATNVTLASPDIDAELEWTREFKCNSLFQGRVVPASSTLIYQSRYTDPCNSPHPPPPPRCRKI